MPKAKRKTKIIITITITITIIMQNLYAVCRLPCNVPINSSARAFSTFQRGIHFFPGRSLARHHVNDYVSLSGSRWRTAARTLAAAWAYEHICDYSQAYLCSQASQLTLSGNLTSIRATNVYDLGEKHLWQKCHPDTTSLYVWRQNILSYALHPWYQPHS